MKWLNNFRRGSWFSLICLASFVSSIFITPSTVRAQLIPWDHSNQVMVDLSVLDEISTQRGFSPYAGVSRSPKLGGHLATRLSNPINPGRQLLEPPKSSPVSSFLINQGLNKVAKGNQRPSVKLISPLIYKKRSSISKRKLAAIKRKSRSTKKTAKNKPRIAKTTPKNNPKSENNSKIIPSKKSDLAAKQQIVKTGEMPSPPTILPVPPPPTKVAKLSPVPNNETLKQPESAKSKLQEKQQAALPQTVASTSSANVVFSPGGSQLSPSAQKALDIIANELKSNEKIRMQLMAYAGESKMPASKARRLSLSRALAVRTYLIEKGVRGTRIDVRALGNKVSSGLPNRVDLRVIGK